MGGPHSRQCWGTPPRVIVSPPWPSMLVEVKRVTWSHPEHRISFSAGGCLRWGPRYGAVPGGGRGSRRRWAQPTRGCRSWCCRGSALALPMPKHEAVSKDSTGTR